MSEPFSASNRKSVCLFVWLFLYFEIQSEGLNQGSQREKDERSIASQIVGKKKNKTKQNLQILFSTGFRPILSTKMAKSKTCKTVGLLDKFAILPVFRSFFLALSFSTSFGLHVPIWFCFPLYRLSFPWNCG